MQSNFNQGYSGYSVNVPTVYSYGEEKLGSSDKCTP